MTGLVDTWAKEALGALERASLRRALTPMESAQGPVVRLAGRDVVNFAHNDYLGLAGDAGLRAAARDCLDGFGTGSGASRLVTGDSTVHQALEAALAQFEGTQAALLFNSGYAANLGVVPALVGPGDVVFSDALNHASLVDGCRLSRATVVVYPHADVQALAALVRATPGRRRLVVTDTVFSMDGDVAPLAELKALCDAQQLALYVDEAHATGVLGPTGAGLCEALGISADVRMGTLSKALGGFGAYVAASRATCDYLLNAARPLVFSTALPPPVCAAALAALARVRDDQTLRARLWRNIRLFASGLRALGLPAHETSAVQPVVLGSPERALQVSAAMLEAGVLVKAIRPPTVPEGTSRLRFSLSAGHTEAQVQQALEALAQSLKDAPPARAAGRRG